MDIDANGCQNFLSTISTENFLFDTPKLSARRLSKRFRKTDVNEQIYCGIKRGDAQKTNAKRFVRRSIHETCKAGIKRGNAVINGAEQMRAAEKQCHQQHEFLHVFFRREGRLLKQKVIILML